VLPAPLVASRSLRPPSQDAPEFSAELPGNVRQRVI
jgi:hypothetical protein